MLKHLMVSLVSSAVIFSGMTAEASSFGSRSSSSRSSSSFSRPSAPSSSFSRPTQAAPSSSSGGISSGGSVGMTRSTVSNNVKNGTNVAPANESTVAGRNPGGVAPSTQYGNTGGYSQNRNYNNGGSYAAPTQGHSTGALVGAAAAGAIGGYMLNGLMHNRDGSVYSGAGYNNGVPIQGYNQQGYDNGGGGYNNGAVMGAAPVVINSGTSIWWSILGFLLVCIVLYVLWNMIFGSKKNSNEGETMNSKSPEAELRDSKEQFFNNFQKNNKPSGLSYIRSNSDPMLYDAISEDIKGSSETRVITVKSLEAKLENVEQEGSSYVASVSYKGVLSEQESGQAAVITDVNELWNFKYTSNGWKLAGIEQL